MDMWFLIFDPRKRKRILFVESWYCFTGANISYQALMLHGLLYIEFLWVMLYTRQHKELEVLRSSEHGFFGLLIFQDMWKLYPGTINPISTIICYTWKRQYKKDRKIVRMDQKWSKRHNGRLPVSTEIDLRLHRKQVTICRVYVIHFRLLIWVEICLHCCIFNIFSPELQT